MRTMVEDNTITNQAFWYALRSKPKFEFIVYSQLEENQIENYFPRLDVKPTNPRSKTEKPYFPGYLFVRGEIGDLYNKRLGLMRGVIGLVNFDNTPASISDGLIEVIRRQVERENSKLNPDLGRMRPGERVWIADPMLQGIEARFEQCINGEDRVAVLLSYMGRTVRLQVDADKVSKRAF